MFPQTCSPFPDNSNCFLVGDPADHHSLLQFIPHTASRIIFLKYKSDLVTHLVISIKPPVASIASKIKFTSITLCPMHLWKPLVRSVIHSRSPSNTWWVEIGLLRKTWVLKTCPWHQAACYYFTSAEDITPQMIIITIIIFIIIASPIMCLLCVRHYCKWFPCIISFNLQQLYEIITITNSIFHKRKLRLWKIK